MKLQSKQIYIWKCNNSNEIQILCLQQIENWNRNRYRYRNGEVEPTE